MEGVKQVVSSSVRFKPLDDGPVSWRKPSDLFFGSFVVKSVEAIANWKINVFWFNGPIFLCERIGEQVQTVALSSNDLSSVNLKFGRYIRCLFQSDEEPIAMKVRIVDNTVWFGLRE